MDCPPVTKALNDGVPQSYFVLTGMIPLIPSVGVISKYSPLQITAVNGSNVPPGLTVTIAVKLAPIQLPDWGVTV